MYCGYWRSVKFVYEGSKISLYNCNERQKTRRTNNGLIIWSIVKICCRCNIQCWCCCKPTWRSTPRSYTLLTRRFRRNQTFNPSHFFFHYRLQWRNETLIFFNSGKKENIEALCYSHVGILCRSQIAYYPTNNNLYVLWLFKVYHSAFCDLYRISFSFNVHCLNLATAEDSLFYNVFLLQNL